MDETDFKNLFVPSKFLWPLNDWLHNTYSDLSRFWHPVGVPLSRLHAKAHEEKLEQSLLAIRKD